MSHYTMLYEYGKQTRDLGAFLSRGGGGVLPKKMGRGVRPASQNLYPIYE